jgi:hypothetical protein
VMSHGNDALDAAETGDGVIVLHQSLVDGSALSEGVFVPPMTAVCWDEDAS